MNLTESRDLLKDAQKSAIRFMESRGFSRDQIGRILGYSGRSMVDSVMSDSTDLFGLPQTLVLTRFCSEHGFDDPANIFSDDTKVNVRVTAHANGHVDDDIAVAAEGIGMARMAFRDGDMLAMGSYLTTAFHGFQGLLAERALRLSHRGGKVCNDLFAGMTR